MMPFGSSSNRSRRAIFRVVATASLTSLTLIVVACQGVQNTDDPLSSTATAVPTVVSLPTATSTPSPTPSPETNIPPAATVLPSAPDVPPTVVAQKPPTPTPVLLSATTVPAPSNTVVADPTATPSPPATPKAVFVPALAEPDIPVAPDRDLQELGRRLVKGYVEPETALPSVPLTVGQQVDFWVNRDAGNVMINGEVSHISDHVYWIFERGYEPDPAAIAEVARKFETEVWPAVTNVFSTPLMPGIDGDDRIVVYTTVLRTGVAGYFSSADSYPEEIRPHSNQREALYMSANRIDLTSTEYLSVLAHELQHATHFAADNGEESWVNEGLSEIAADLAGFARSAVSSFVRAPATSLTAWAQDIGVSAANYGAANLFFAFLATDYGGNDMLAAVSRNQEDGISSIDSALAEQGFDASANDVFADWLVANYLSTNEGPYGYENIYIPPVRNIYKRAPDSLSGSVRSYGADYLVTSSGSGSITVEFSGEPETSLLNSAPYSGATCWWSNQGDSIDSTLTRVVDLRSVDSATLKYWVDYKIEEFWDYGYLMVSVDDGTTWDILHTERAINYNPNGNAYGAGITGTSLGWVQDSVDLTNYTGQQVLLRFEYVTDDAVFSVGACFDNFEIPEIGWSDDTATAGDWVANGFARVEETVPTQYLVQVIHEKAVGDPIVYQVPVGANGMGALTVENVGEDDLVVAVVSAVTRQSTRPTEYTLSIVP